MNLNGEEGYLTKATINGHSAIGLLTDAGVFRPITDSEVSSHGAIVTVLPSYTTVFRSNFQPNPIPAAGRLSLLRGEIGPLDGGQHATGPKS